MSLATIDQTYSSEILKAIGINDRDPKAQAAVLVCQKYGFDPLLKHVVLIQGSIYVTRDGLLSVAHRSGKLDGIVVQAQGKDATHYTATVSVYRKDMTHPFTYVGRYPIGGSNKLYGREMAVKCAEVMALRRAFDVSLCAREEMWDQGEDIEVTPTTTKAIAAPTRQQKSMEARYAEWLANAAHNLGLSPSDLELALELWAAENMDASEATVHELALAHPELWQSAEGGFRLACRRLKAATGAACAALRRRQASSTATTDEDADPDFE